MESIRLTSETSSQTSETSSQTSETSSLRRKNEENKCKRASKGQRK